MKRSDMIETGGEIIMHTNETLKKNRLFSVVEKGGVIFVT